VADPQLHPDDDEWPRVLIVSNNPLSATSNNGKTLASLFQRFPGDRIAQLYFSAEAPSGRPDFRYYRIDEREFTRSLLATDPGGTVVAASPTPIGIPTTGGRQPSLTGLAFRLKDSHLVRLLREMLWLRRRVDHSSLASWIEAAPPDLVFLCAGDSLFAYRTVEQIVALTGASLAVFVTDDYILPGRWRSALGRLRRALVASRMQRAVGSAAAFFTISPKMQRVYRNVLDRDSVVIGNATPSVRLPAEDDGKKAVTTLVYAGSLHSGRAGVLAALAQSISTHNATCPSAQRAFLEVYTGTELSPAERERLNRPGASRLSGLLGAEAYRRAINGADIAVHVESFDRDQIAVTRLSLSTKIAEYLSLGKPILAIGPAEVASMEYLASVAECVTNPASLLPRLDTLLGNDELQRRLGRLALQLYQEHHASDVVLAAFHAALRRAAPRPGSSTGI
jgi:hypothetical protein